MNGSKTAYTMSPIGLLQSCFDEKFGVPRQSMMISEARGVLKFNPDPQFNEAFGHLEGFSHLWIIYVFDRNIAKGWQPIVQPPRLEAPKNVGVFASRAPHRPNPIGLSVAKLERIDFEALGGIEIHLSGLDILNNTPVLDVKPYLPFADSHPQASSGWASEEIQKYPVNFSELSLVQIRISGTKHHPRLKNLLVQILELDPRPTSQRFAVPLEDPQSEGHPYAFRIFDFDVKWEIREKGIYVVELAAL